LNGWLVLEVLLVADCIMAAVAVLADIELVHP
jgi:hypothetical protein